MNLTAIGTLTIEVIVGSASDMTPGISHPISPFLGSMIRPDN